MVRSAVSPSLQTGMISRPALSPADFSLLTPAATTGVPGEIDPHRPIKKSRAHSLSVTMASNFFPAYLELRNAARESRYSPFWIRSTSRFSWKNSNVFKSWGSKAEFNPEKKLKLNGRDRSNGEITRILRRACPSAKTDPLAKSSSASADTTAAPNRIPGVAAPVFIFSPREFSRDRFGVRARRPHQHAY